MKIFRRLLPLLCLAVGASALAAGNEDVVFRAMQDELHRSVDRLVIEKMSRPYFLSYRVEDNDRIVIEARYGSLVQTQRTADRYLYIDLRVGDSTLDNTNFVGSWGDIYRVRKDLADEDDYDALRHQIWLATDDAYKKALEDLGRKKAYLSSHPSQDTLADFSSAPHTDVEGKAVPLSVDAAAWESGLKTAAETLRAFPALQDWKITYTATATGKRYLNSEGARHTKSALTHQLEVTATAQAADGQRISSFRRFITRDEETPPHGEELIREVRKLGEELSAAVAAPVLEEYAGPVLFTGYASAQLVSQLFVSQISPARGLLTAEDWMAQYFQQGKLAARLNRRVLPDFVSISDDPHLSEWKGHRLLGHQAVDDQGVAASTITLVDHGRLTALPTTRQPTKKIRLSNGHARALANQWNVPALTSVLVSTDKPVAAPQMLERLRRLAKESGNEYGLLVTLLEDTQVSDDYSWAESSDDKDKLLASPLVAFRVWVKDGRVEPVRGLMFDDVTVRSLRDVAALGKDEQLHGVLQPSALPQLQYPVSIVTPSILVEEMELKSNPAHEPLPLSANPLFDTKH